MTEAMWSREAISAILSILGTPMKPEHLNSPWDHALRASVMLDYTWFFPPTVPVVVIKNILERITHLKVRVRSSLPRHQLVTSSPVLGMRRGNAISTGDRI